MTRLVDSTSLVVNAYALLAGKSPGNSDLNAIWRSSAQRRQMGTKSTIDSMLKGCATTQLAPPMRTNLKLTSVFTQANAEDYLNANAGNRVGAMVVLADILTTYTATITSVLAAKTGVCQQHQCRARSSTNTAITDGKCHLRKSDLTLSTTSSEPINVQPGNDNPDRHQRR